MESMTRKANRRESPCRRVRRMASLAQLTTLTSSSQLNENSTTSRQRRVLRQRSSPQGEGWQGRSRGSSRGTRCLQGRATLEPAPKLSKCGGRGSARLSSCLCRMMWRLAVLKACERTSLPSDMGWAAAALTGQPSDPENHRRAPWRRKT